MIIETYLPKDFDKLEHSWRKLEKGHDMTVFQSFEWYRMVNKNYLESRLLRPLFSGLYLLVRDDDGTPLLIAPLMKQKMKLGSRFPKAVYFLGRETCTDYFNFIYQDLSPKLLRFCLEHVKARLKCDKFCFTRVLETTQLYKHLMESYACRYQSGECVSLSAPESYDTFYDGLSNNVRQNFRRCINRLRRDEISLEIEATDTINDSIKQEIKSLYLERQQEKRKNERKNMSLLGAMYNKLIRFSTKELPVLDQFSSLWLISVRDTSGKLVYFFYGPYEKETKTARMLFTGLDSKYYPYSLGVNTWILFIKKSFEIDGKLPVSVLDFTRGSEDYKYRIGGRPHYIYSLSFEV